MKIDVASLPEPGKAFAYQYQPEELTLPDDRVSLLDPQPAIEGRAARVRDRVKLSGIIKGRLQLECDRCLKAITKDVEAKLDREFTTTAAYEAQHAVELSEAD